VPAHLTLLGPPRLLTGRGPVDVPDSLPGYLLAYLGARSDWVLRDELAALLWPAAAADEAQHNLRVNLNRLRTLLRGWGLEPALGAERRRLRLQLATDLQTLQQACACGDGPQLVAHGGRFLEGLSCRAFGGYADWAHQLGERLRAEWRDALLRAAAAAPAPQVLALTDALAADERLAEQVQRLRLAALVALGRADDARREHAAFRAGLQAELDAAPSADFEAFAARLLAPARTTPSIDRRAGGDADAFIGRADELQDARQLLAGSRLLTLAGLGGVGKTRLARALHDELAPDFPAGSRWLSLAELATPAQVLGALADAVGAAPAVDKDGLAAVAGRLGSARWLLLLDNAEHLLDAGRALPGLVDALRAACPGLRLIVTSREPLGLADEAVLRLQGLAVPAAAGAAALSSAAVQLFVAQARRVAPAFDPTAEPGPVVRVARLTGGLPLALRIAAGWLRWLSCAQVADEVQHGLDALDTGGAQGVLGVRATLERSWQRLPPAERQTLARLAVFAGAFDPAAARDVAGAGLPLLAGLAEVSMLEPVRDPAGHRFQLHPLVRQAALERLDADHADGAATRAAHRRWLQRALAPMADWRRIDQRAALERIAALLEELRAAWRSAVDHADAPFIATVAPVVARFLEQKGAWNEGLHWFEPPQAHFDPALPGELAALAALARSQAVMLYRKTDLDAAETVGQRALTWARALGHAEGIKSCLNTLGLTLLMQARTGPARAFFEEAAGMAAADGDAAGEAVFSANVALADKRAGHFAAAAAAWQRSLALHREVGNWRSAVNVLNNLGNLLRIESRYTDALPLIEEGLRLCDEHGFASTRPFLLINLARLHADAGRGATAAELARQVLDDLGRGAEPMIEAAALQVLAQLALQAGDDAAAAPLLARALRSTASTGDMANRLETLDGYGQWLAVRGEPARAAAVWQLLLAHPALHAELRLPLQRQLDALAVPAQPLAAAPAEFGACCERALRELENAVRLTS